MQVEVSNGGEGKPAQQGGVRPRTKATDLTPPAHKEGTSKEKTQILEGWLKNMRTPGKLKKTRHAKNTQENDPKTTVATNADVTQPSKEERWDTVEKNTAPGRKECTRLETIEEKEWELPHEDDPIYLPDSAWSRPWTKEDWKAARAKSEGKEPPVTGYSLVQADLAYSIECLFFDITGTDTQTRNESGDQEKKTSFPCTTFRGTPMIVDTETVESGGCGTITNQDPDEQINGSWKWNGGAITPDDPRGPCPLPVFQIATAKLQKEGGREILDVHSWKNTTTTEKVAIPLHFGGHVNGVLANILYDTGSGTQIISKSFAEKIGANIQASKIACRLNYGDGKSAITSTETGETNISIGGVRFKEQFLINPFDIPGVDIILGRSFQDRVRSEIRYGPKSKISTHQQPYVQFPSGERIYTKGDIRGTTGVDFMCITTEEADIFLKDEMKRNGTLQDIEFYKVSVQKEFQMTGRIANPAEGTQLHHPDIQAIINKYDIMREKVPTEDIFKRETPFYHHIPLEEGAEPVKKRAIPLSAPKMDTIRALIQELVANGTVEPGSLASPWGAPVILARKAGNRPGLTNAWRLILDFRGLNKITKKTFYSPPAIRDIMDDLVGAVYFSKTDCVGGFYQLPLHPDDRDKTTFRIRTDKGLEAYRFTVSTLGLQGCPSSYQEWMEKILEGIEGVRVYLDDIVYFSKSWEEHLQLLETVFARLQEHKVYLHPMKCVFGQKEMEYLGLKISHNRIQVADEKKAALREYEAPTTYPSLQRFLGFANYLNSFIPHYASKAAVLTDLLTGGARKKKFIWTAACQTAFDQIKAELQAATGLGIPDKRGDLVLETDASGLGVGACLYQLIDERLTPLWYLSKKLNRAEQNYSSRDREALAVVYALNKLEGYLAQKPFVLYSDHESLIHLQTQKDLKGRDWRWQEIISRFSFEQRYRKGETMFVSDALSRAFENKNAAEQGAWDDITHKYEESINPQVGFLNARKPVNMNICSIAIQKVIRAPQNNPNRGVDITKEMDEILAKDKKKGTNTRYGFVDSATYTITSRVFGDLGKAIQTAYLEDKDFKDIYRLTRQPQEKLTKVELSMCRKYSQTEGLLFYTDKEGEAAKLVVPRNQGNSLRLTILFEGHDALTHYGAEHKTFDRISKRYWWPTLWKDCAAYVDSCKTCKMNASVQKRPEGGMETHPIPEGRWDTIHMDFITDLPRTEKGHDAILVVHDKVTKYAHFIPAAKTDTAEETATRLFASVFCLHGLPQQIISDRDRLFTARFFAQLMRILGVKQTMGTSYQHNFNGASERLNRTVEVMLRNVVGNHIDRDFDNYLPLIAWSYNTTIHDSIGVSPFYAQWGYEPRTSLQITETLEKDPNRHRSLQDYVEHQQKVLTQVREALKEAQTTMELYVNRSRRDPEDIKVGDEVYLSAKNLGSSHFKQTAKKLQPRFVGPFRVEAKMSEYTYKLDLTRNKSMSRLHPIFHVALLWKSKPTPEHLKERFSSDVTAAEQQPAEPEPKKVQVPEGKIDQKTAEEIITKTDNAADAPTPEDDFEVDALLDRKKMGSTYKYLVKWKGYGPEENTWEPRKNLLGEGVKKLAHALDAKIDAARKARKKKARQAAKASERTPCTSANTDPTTEQ